ncbi:hypothetical protein HanIR_Chr10g0468911 [Helianthus annuus]|nr:hypothetical protein HanIR_Chr10g0468911 [Helianthus annuus]
MMNNWVGRVCLKCEINFEMIKWFIKLKPNLNVLNTIEICVDPHV